MKKLLSALLLLLFSIHAFGKPLYVRLESDGDLIFSNSPITETKPDTLPKKKPISTLVTKENAKPTTQPKNTSMTTETTKENTNYMHPVNISLPNNIPIIAAVTEKNLLITYPSDEKMNHTKNKPRETEATKDNLNSSQKTKIDLPEKPIMADITEENTNKKSAAKPRNIPMIADTVKEDEDDFENANIIPIPTLNTHTNKKIKKETLYVIEEIKHATRTKNKPISAKVSNENTHKSQKPNLNAKSVNLAKNKPIPVKDKKEKITKTPADEVHTKLTYKTFRITSPLNKEVLENLALLVDLKVEPKLQQHHKILLFIDGKRINKPSSNTHINANGIKKGSHEMYGLIIDKNKNFVMQSNVITIYIKEAKAKPKTPAAAPKLAKSMAHDKLTKSTHPKLAKPITHYKLAKAMHPTLAKPITHYKLTKAMHPKLTKPITHYKLAKAMHPTLAKPITHYKLTKAMHPTLAKVTTKHVKKVHA